MVVEPAVTVVVAAVPVVIVAIAVEEVSSLNLALQKD